MDVAYISGSTIPSKKANSIHVMKMCNAISEEGVSVKLFAMKRNNKSNDTFEYYGLDRNFEVEYVYRIPIDVVGPAVYSILVALKVKQMSNIDVIYSRHRYALACLITSGTPFVYETHTMPKGEVETKTERLLFRSKSFKYLVVVSRKLKKDFLSTFTELSPKSVIVAHDASDKPKIDQSISPNLWPGRTSSLQVGYSGHLYPGKGMEVISKLAPKIPSIDFHIIGGSKKEIKKWKQKAHYENLHYHGHVPHKSMSLYYNSIDVGICPLQDFVIIPSGKNISRWTSPLKIFEYMAHGLAVICSDLDVLKEVVEHGENGLIAERDSVQDWKSKINKLKCSKELRDKLSENAKNDHADRYTWKSRARRLLSKIL